MIKDSELWKKWERAFLKSQPADPARNLRLVDAMYEEARSLGLFRSKDPLEGLDIKIATAKILNV